MTEYTSRRRFLKAAAATGALAGFNVAVLAQGNGQNGEVILLGGRTPGWEGYRLPGEAEATGATNPTLTLQEGTTYTLLWTNLDGVGHNFAIQDADGNNLEVLQPLSAQPEVFEEANQTAANQTISFEVADGNVTGVTTGNMTDEEDGDETTTPEAELVDQTEIISGEGSVQAVRFTATSEMAQYICLVHPNTMVGDLEVQSGDGDGMANNSSG